GEATRGLTGQRMPALLKKTSTPRKRSRAGATYRRTSAACVTSASTVRAFPPAFSTAIRLSASPAVEMSTRTTLAPSDANRRAAARPMPPAAPVMTTTLFWNRVTRQRSDGRDDRALDHELRVGNRRLHRRARRRVLRIDPSVPDGVHVVEEAHVRDVDRRRE